MRLDKYLKVSRLIKRRTVAKEVCDAGRISINGNAAKAGSQVKAGDKLLISFGSRRMEVEVLSTPETVRADEAKLLYNIISDNKASSLD